MIKNLIGILSIFSLTALADDQSIFDYDSFYLTKNNRLFNIKNHFEAEGGFFKNMPEDMISTWTGKVHGRFYYLEAQGNTIKVNRHKYDLKKSKLFNNDQVDNDLFLKGFGFYIEKNMLCIEPNVQKNGKYATRYSSIYLIDIDRLDFIVKMPSLFASCMDIGRAEKGWYTFTEKIYSGGDMDSAKGIDFIEYKTDGHHFVKTNTPISHGIFLDESNMFKFKITK